MWREALKKNLTGTGFFWCTRFGCGHQWHAATSRECDCSDYVRPPELKTYPSLQSSSPSFAPNEHERSGLYFASSAELRDLMGERLAVYRDCLPLPHSMKQPVGRQASHLDGVNTPAHPLKKKIRYIAAA